jgi:hypothetical protein
MQFCEKCFRGLKEILFGLEEVAARMLFRAERLKFLMSERDNLGNLGFPDCQASLRKFSRAQKSIRPLLHSLDLFRAFLGQAKNAHPSPERSTSFRNSSIVRRFFA